MACDALESNLHYDYLIENFPNKNFKNRQLKEICELRLPAQTIYILYIQKFSIDSTDYETLFETFINFKIHLDHNRTTEFTLNDFLS